MLQPEIKKENKHVWKSTDSNKERLGKGIKKVFSLWEVKCSIPGNFAYLTKSPYPSLEKKNKKNI